MRRASLRRRERMKRLEMVDQCHDEKIIVACLRCLREDCF